MVWILTESTTNGISTVEVFWPGWPEHVESNGITNGIAGDQPKNWHPLFRRGRADGRLTPKKLFPIVGGSYGQISFVLSGRLFTGHLRPLGPNNLGGGNPHPRCKCFHLHFDRQLWPQGSKHPSPSRVRRRKADTPKARPYSRGELRPNFL